MKPAFSGQAEVRRHYFLDQYVVIAPKRTHSLHHKKFPKSGPLKSPPLESEQSVLEIPGPDGRWSVKVISNINPAFTPGNKNAFGIQEVVLENNPADIVFSSLPAAQIERIFLAYIQRIEALRQLPNINYVSVFHNDGLEAGASIRQSHSQIIAIGPAPPDLIALAKVATKFKKRFGASAISKAIAWEQQRLTRIIYNNNELAVIAPYASQFPYEAWLIPKRAVSSIRELGPRELSALARALKALTQAVENQQMSYNFYLYEDVVGYENHFMIKLVPRPNVWAGFELNTGITINPVPPEEAARWYRQFIREHHAL